MRGSLVKEPHADASAVASREPVATQPLSDARAGAKATDMPHITRVGAGQETTLHGGEDGIASECVAGVYRETSSFRLQA